MGLLHPPTNDTPGNHTRARSIWQVIIGKHIDSLSADSANIAPGEPCCTNPGHPEQLLWSKQMREHMRRPEHSTASSAQTCLPELQTSSEWEPKRWAESSGKGWSCNPKEVLGCLSITSQQNCHSAIAKWNFVMEHTTPECMLQNTFLCVRKWSNVTCHTSSETVLPALIQSTLCHISNLCRTLVLGNTRKNSKWGGDERPSNANQHPPPTWETDPWQYNWLRGARLCDSSTYSLLQTLQDQGWQERWFLTIHRAQLKNNPRGCVRYPNLFWF